MPPWLQEQIAKLQQAQNSLQGVLTQKQHVESEKIETDRALEELNKAGENDDVFKHAGSILIKSTKPTLIAELEERKELAATRGVVLSKQEARLREELKTLEEKVTKMLSDPTGSGGQTPQPASQTPPPPPSQS